MKVLHNVQDLEESLDSHEGDEQRGDEPHQWSRLGERRVRSTHSLVNHLSGVERDDTSRSARNKLYICTTITWQLTGV